MKKQFYMAYVASDEKGGTQHGNEIFGFDQQANHDLTLDNLAHAHNYLKEKYGYHNVVILSAIPILVDDKVVK